MDQTPTRASRFRHADFQMLDEGQLHDEDSLKSGKIRKPPPITPRRFNKFFAPRAQPTATAVRTSRKALRTISSSALNSRQRSIQEENETDDYGFANENQVSRKKRKYSSITSSLHSTPQSRAVSFLPSSQDILPSSPIKYDQDDHEDVVDDDSDASTEIADEEAWSHDEDDLPAGPRIVPYAGTSTSRSLLATNITGKRSIRVAGPSNLWQAETANFYSNPEHVDSYLRAAQPPIIPFSMASCNTNPVVAVGDEEGVVRLLDPHVHEDAQDGPVNGFGKTVLRMQPHENAVMDMVFSHDDNLMATASGDQTCQLVDVQTQSSLYSLRAHTASVKKILFQPGTGNKLLASAGRDGSIYLWDLRVKGQPASTHLRSRPVSAMAKDVPVLAPVLEIHDAHNPNAKTQSALRKTKYTSIAGRNDFSITSMTFLDESRSNLLATASEVDTTIKLWDLRQSQLSPRKRGHTQLPISITEEPRSQANHRKFGINSIAISTDSSRIFALSRDHTVYAYSTSHLILGCTPESVPTSSGRRSLLAPMRTSSSTGLGPLYGLRHPNLRVATFWPRLAIRKCNETHSEILAVGSTEDCAILFPTSEKYHTASARHIPALHDPTSSSTPDIPATPRRSSRIARPGMNRNPTSSFTTLFTKDRQQEDALTLPIYYHGTPLIHGHNKEVTSVAWNSEGNLVTASDDFTIRCWREDANIARRLRSLNSKGNRDEAALLRRGWADVGVEGWDDDE
ncbi:hypothetical protein LTS08_006512 [Lithohypha guttulata]|nr:hypothetical protein LTS08_006512 [Lithohypha guttulata]